MIPDAALSRSITAVSLPQNSFCPSTGIRFRTAIATSLLRCALGVTLVAGLLPSPLAQTLLNIDFGVGSASGKSGRAATGQGTNDYWNLYRHYDPRFVPGMPLVHEGSLARLRLADGSPSTAQVAVRHAPGVWGNTSGDPMWDTYLYNPDGSNVVVTLSGLSPGRYHLYAYGHADADVSPEFDSQFSLVSGDHRQGPAIATGGSHWTPAVPMEERRHYVVFRDVPVHADQPVVLIAAPGPGGLAVLNGLQVLSRGTGAPLVSAPTTPPPEASTNLWLRSVEYLGHLSDTEARFSVAVEAESLGTNTVSTTLAEGHLALLNPHLPEGWHLVQEGERFTLVATTPATTTLTFDVVARITRDEPWRQTTFIGPRAATATLAVTLPNSGAQLEWLSGTPLPLSEDPNTFQGILPGSGKVSLRWQSRTTGSEPERTALVTVDTATVTQLSPAVLRHLTTLQLHVLQGRLASTRIALPPSHTLTHLHGPHVRQWLASPQPDDSSTIIDIDFIQPVDAQTTLQLATEQSLPNLPDTATLEPPQPLGVQRETGTLHLATEDLRVRLGTAVGLRQINAPAPHLAAYRFHARPARIDVQLERLTPEIHAATHTRIDLQDTRVVARHSLHLDVRQAGLYALQLLIPTGFTVTDVRAPGLDGWSVSADTLHLPFSERVLGPRTLEVDLERPLATDHTTVELHPLRLPAATRESFELTLTSAPGLRLRTSSRQGIVEIPSNTPDERLAFRAESSDWQLTLNLERPEARLVAEAFHLLTIGDGFVSGSVTLRFGIFQQGLQQFRLRLPAHWRNVEFTGPQVRRRDRQDQVWTVGLQDKAWGAYTLVISFDHPIDPQLAQLPVESVEVLDAERQTTFFAITSAASLEVTAEAVPPQLRPIDPTELPSADRDLIARPVLLAYRASERPSPLTLLLTRHQEIPILDAVADRTQLVTVLTQAGEALTQAGFLVKNNDRQFQRFQLPPGAELWGAYVNGEPVKAERDGDWLLVSLPRQLNRDQAFAVDLKYAERLGALPHFFTKHLRLAAPSTDIPSTYAAWELFLPGTHRLSGFSGSLLPVSGTTYQFRDAWDEFVQVYRSLWLRSAPLLIFGGGFLALIVALIISARRHGFGGMTTVLVVFALLAILASMLLPALAKAKAKATTIKSVNNLKQIGLAARIWATDNHGQLPPSIDAMRGEIGSEQILTNPDTGQPYIYLGAGRTEAEPHAILAYGETRDGGQYTVAFADGSVQILTRSRFQEALERSQATATSPDLQSPSTPTPPLLQRYGLPSPAAAPARGLALGDEPVQAASPPSPPPTLDQASTTTPTAAGLRAIRIDIPRTGVPIQFHKVLNLRGEPLTIEATLMRTRTYQTVRMLLEVSAFLVGLALVFWQWRRPQPQAAWMAFGAGLILLSTLSLFIAWRALHLVLIYGVPVVAFILVGNVVATWLRRRSLKNHPPASPPSPPSPPSIATVSPLLLAASLGLLLPGLPPSAHAAKPSSAPTTPATPATLIHAAYQGILSQEVATFTAHLTITSSHTNQSLNLFPDSLDLGTLEVISGTAHFGRDASHVTLLLPTPGTVELTASFVTRVQGDITRRWLALALPPALGATMELTLDDPEVEVEAPSALSLRSIPDPDRPRVEMVLGHAPTLEVSWTPRRRQLAELPATVLVEMFADATIGAGLASIQTALQIQPSQGELRQLVVHIPLGHRLLRVHGNNVRTWDMPADGAPLTVEFLQPTSSPFSLILETEVPLDSLPTSLTLTLPTPRDVRRVTGLISLKTAEETALTLERTEGIQRTDPSTLRQPEPIPGISLHSVHRFLNPEFQLVLRIEPLRPEILAHARHAFTVAPDRLQVVSHFQTEILKVGVFSLSFSLPPDLRVDQVICPPMARWTENPGSPHTLVIEFPGRTLGPVPIELHLTRSWDQPPASLDLSGPTPDLALRPTATLAVGASPGVSLKTSSLDGLVEIPVATLDGGPRPLEGTLLAFKSLPREPGSAPGRVSLTTEPIPPWVRAEVVHVVTLQESFVTGRTLIRYDVQNAPQRLFHVLTPASWKNVEIVGQGIRRRDQDGQRWTVELQTGVRGLVELTVAWEETRPNPTAPWLLAGFSIPEVERESGMVAVQARAPLQITPNPATTEFTRIDSAELPEWSGARTTGTGALLAWRYLRPGGVLHLDVQRFSDAEVLQALVDSLHLTTVVADDGQLITQLRMIIRHNGRQHLELTLPPQTTVWSAFVAGQPVRPRQRQNRLLLPLDAGLQPHAAVNLEVTYVAQSRFPRTRGRLRLEAPRFDLPLKDARWDFFLPPDFEYSDFGGSMTHALTDLSPLAQDFTLAEYRRQEEAQVQSDASEILGLVSRARGKLAAGRIADVKDELSQAKRRAGRDLQTEQEVRQLEEELNRAQGSNLIQAQNEYFFSNALRLESGSAPQQASPSAAYSIEDAQRLAAVVQKAQAVSLNRIEPLRINLPTRGIRHSFTQVLQTDPGKPLTVEFHARNLRESGFFSRAFRIIAAFLGLWILAGLVLLFRPHPSERG